MARFWLPAVANELLNPRGNLPSLNVSVLPGVRVVTPSDTSAFSVAVLRLDPGEIEALSLAVELKARIILIDERRGRAAALRAGLQPVGVLGTLASGKEAGLLSMIAPLLDRLEANIGFHISQQLRGIVLRQAGEIFESS